MSLISGSEDTITEDTEDKSTDVFVPIRLENKGIVDEFRDQPHISHCKVAFARIVSHILPSLESTLVAERKRGKCLSEDSRKIRRRGCQCV